MQDSLTSAPSPVLANPKHNLAEHVLGGETFVRLRGLGQPLVQDRCHESRSSLLSFARRTLQETLPS
jgi:hypothetical protein